MNRKQALELVGKQVSAWTSVNGEYVGTLVEVTNDKPWRGRVKITGILKFACPFEFGRRVQRKGKKPGEMIEVGNCSIKPCDNPGMSYMECLLSTLSSFKKHRDDVRARPKDWHNDLGWIEPSIVELEQRILEELNANIQWTDTPEGKVATYGDYTLRVGNELDGGGNAYFVSRQGDMNANRGEADNPVLAMAMAINLLRITMIRDWEEAHALTPA